MNLTRLTLIATLLVLTACQQAESPAPAVLDGATAEPVEQPGSDATLEQASRFDIYATVRLTADVGHLSERQKQMIPLLIDASKIMDGLFWQQSWGDMKDFLDGIEDPATRRFAEINYGPWDRLDADRPFIENVGHKPLGAQFYPADMSKEEFEAWDQIGKDGLYSLVRRGQDGGLELVPYHLAYAEELKRAAALLREAAGLADDEEFVNYLQMRFDTAPHVQVMTARLEIAFTGQDLCYGQALALKKFSINLHQLDLAGGSHHLFAGNRVGNPLNSFISQATARRHCAGSNQQYLPTVGAQGTELPDQLRQHIPVQRPPPDHTVPGCQS